MIASPSTKTRATAQFGNGPRRKGITHVSAPSAKSNVLIVAYGTTCSETTIMCCGTRHGAADGVCKPFRLRHARARALKLVRRNRHAAAGSRRRPSARTSSARRRSPRRGLGRAPADSRTVENGHPCSRRNRGRRADAGMGRALGTSCACNRPVRRSADVQDGQRLLESASRPHERTRFRNSCTDNVLQNRRARRREGPVRGSKSGPRVLGLSTLRPSDGRVLHGTVPSYGLGCERAIVRCLERNEIVHFAAHDGGHRFVLYCGVRCSGCARADARSLIDSRSVHGRAFSHPRLSMRRLIGSRVERSRSARKRR